jgi:hypothetical protein
MCLHATQNFGTANLGTVPYAPEILGRCAYRTAAFIGSVLTAWLFWERGLTPNLDAPARQSVVFTRSYPKFG